MKTYKERKEEIREEAMDYQFEFEENNYSYGELAWYTRYFTIMGKRYGLLKEFRENGII